MAGSQSSWQPPAPTAPPAFPSHPSDIELIKMLRTRVCPSTNTAPAGNNSSPMIREADVYAEDPADLTRQFAPAVAEDGKKAWYFFSRLEPKSIQGGKRVRRCMDSGVWHDEGKSTPVVSVLGSEAREIGCRNDFSFIKKKVNGKKEGRTGWIMKEFRLDEESRFVLCKIYANSSRRAPNPTMSNKAAPAEEAAVARAALKKREKAVAAREKAVKAREGAVKVREAAVEEREEAVETREKAVAQREEARKAADVEATMVLQNYYNKAMPVSPEVEQMPVITAGVKAVGPVVDVEEMHTVVDVEEMQVAPESVEPETAPVVAAWTGIISSVPYSDLHTLTEHSPHSHQDLNQTRGSEHAYVDVMNPGSPGPQHSPYYQWLDDRSPLFSSDERCLKKLDLALSLSRSRGSFEYESGTISDGASRAPLF